MPLNNRSTFFLLLVVLMAGCHSKEITRLQIENDSLRNELDSRHAAMTPLTDVAAWMDSIDATRALMARSLKDGNSSEELTSQLRNINQFVKMSEDRLEAVQKALKSAKLESSSYLMLVDALKSEVQLRVDDLVELNEQVGMYKDKNDVLTGAIAIRGREVDQVRRQASGKQEELLLLEAKIQAMVNNFKIAEADGYYARARAVEETARRTRLAPQKRRETFREALELYKKSVSLGKQDATTDISRLEKRLD
jgi:hypothetical protein